MLELAYLCAARGSEIVALATAMQRVKARMNNTGLASTWWTLHDLKRKGLTEATDKTIAGHRTEAMR